MLIDDPSNTWGQEILCSEARDPTNDNSASMKLQYCTDELKVLVNKTLWTTSENPPP